MTRLVHDQFAKDYLEELLSPFGIVQQSRPILAEVREIDVWFSPRLESPPPPELGLLGQFCTTPLIFEIYRNPVTEEQIGDCLSKLLEAKREVIRQANRDQVRLDPNRVPRLWILTPTASDPFTGELQSLGGSPVASRDLCSS